MAEQGIQFLTEADIYAIHERAIDEHGGGEGVIDANAIRSAVGQVLLICKYEQGDECDIAAAYLWYLASQQGFRDE